MPPKQEKELLELAAKACEYTLADHYDINGLYWPWCRECGRHWSPLYNAGDCAEMEERLSIDVVWFRDAVECGTTDIEQCERFIDHNGDRGAARRLASVRVAAEIQRRKIGEK